MLLHLSTRPPTTRPRSPNPQPHTALVSFPSAEFCSRFSPCVRLFLGLLHQNTEKENCSVICFLFLADMLHLPCRSRELTFVCGVPTRARLVTWWHEWAPLLAAAGPCLYTPSGSVDLCQLPLYLLPSTVPPPLLHPASSSFPQQRATVTEPHCVWCGRTQTQPLFPFQKAQPSTRVIFLGICPVKYLAGAWWVRWLVVFQVKINKDLTWPL